jgi:uncharacterized OB-fold protein
MAQIPIVDYLVIDDGEPHLRAWESVDSGALYFDRRNADAKSGGTEFKPRKLASTGKVRSFTIVKRGVPGVPVPYASALIDLDGGGCVKANVVNTTIDPEHVTLGMQVQLTTWIAGTDDEGNEAVCFGFEPVA